ncbi:hypothetical protein [Microvirga massiliensis]|uniref:hypothetical protein n=1 Tax=Microvirga massiliensis TaxID=1033741 RepID=UPI00069BD437|nr:hypothetical protein [Microvirga massiliensis]
MNLHVSPQQAAAELLRRRRARESLAGFVNAVEIPGKPVSDDPDAWLYPIETSVAAHHLLLCDKLEAISSTPHGRLMVFMPTGSAKSTYASVVFPTWFMGKRPGARHILTSYGSDLARRHGRRARQIVRSRAYQSLFGTALSADSSAADEWALTNGSEYMAGGILSGITGNRAHGLLIDDPVKGREDADSPVIRRKTLDAYEDDLKTRLIPGGWIALIQTRWHEDDLAGSILPRGWKGESGSIECRNGNVWKCCVCQRSAISRTIRSGANLGNSSGPSGSTGAVGRNSGATRAPGRRFISSTRRPTPAPTFRPIGSGPSSL